MFQLFLLSFRDLFNTNDQIMTLFTDNKRLGTWILSSILQDLVFLIYHVINTYINVNY